jgi:DNA-binding LacI/PurR family transcriptional regulator
MAPGDVLYYNKSFIPRITTMRINTTYMGKIIYQMLMNRMEHRPEDLHVLKVKHQLVRRGTCCPPAASEILRKVQL